MMVAGVAGSIGTGLVAGFVGTVAMTISSTIEQRIRGREASTAPARAAERVLGISEFESPTAERRFSTLVHWGYGTGWGAVRGALRALRLGPTAATAAHFTAVWGGAAITLPALGVAPPIRMWGREEIAIDAWHHVVYVVAAAIAYEALERRRG